jgi:hypothetical protein
VKVVLPEVTGLTIAMEPVANSSSIFMDELTSGVDAMLGLQVLLEDGKEHHGHRKNSCLHNSSAWR